MKALNYITLGRISGGMTPEETHPTCGPLTPKTLKPKTPKSLISTPNSTPCCGGPSQPQAPKKERTTKTIPL